MPTSSAARRPLSRRLASLFALSLVSGVGLAGAIGLTIPAAAQQDGTTASYRSHGEAALAGLRSAPASRDRARNVIIFIGDGMGVSTQTAARIFAGQAQGGDGEAHHTAMDSLDHTALVKTYSHDAQVSDSAATATAIFSGVKTRNGVLGIGPEAPTSDCADGMPYRVPSLMGLAQAEGLATGIVTTTRITHATPAATYAHTTQRGWESDGDLPEAARDEGCTDIARQLIEGEVGSQFDVIMGGGRAAFLPEAADDPEYPDRTGRRTDGRDLIAAWQSANPQGLYAWNSAQLAGFDPAGHSRVLALFEPDHMQYEAERGDDLAGEPSLAEMLETALAALSGSDKGYVLLVEGGRIDHAHHAGNAHRALADAAALDDAVATALRLTSRDETLIVTTADHSHTLTIGGYAPRGNPILGTAATMQGQPSLARDGKAYTTLGYANGPGAELDTVRSDPADVDTTALDYRQQALVPLWGETHGGEDVAVRASGPGARLFRGTIEQHTIFYIMREALFGSQGE